MTNPTASKPVRLLGLPPPRSAFRSGCRPPALAQRGQPIEPIDLPPSVEQGVDMIYIDQEIAPRLNDANVAMHEISFEEWTGAPLDLFVPVNPIYTDLRRGLVRYRQRWGDLPQFQMPAGPALKLGSEGERRRRCCASGSAWRPATKFDAALATAVKEYQAGPRPQGRRRRRRRHDRLAQPRRPALRAADHHQPGARPAPALATEAQPLHPGRCRRARGCCMYENGRPVDSMKVIVGKAETATPMMAAQIRYASVNPYWNVPPELVSNLIAPQRRSSRA